MNNRIVLPEKLAKIRKLADFDLIMLISEIHDYGWQLAECTLDMMPVDGVMPDEETRKNALARSAQFLKEHKFLQKMQALIPR